MMKNSRTKMTIFRISSIVQTIMVATIADVAERLSLQFESNRRYSKVRIVAKKIPVSEVYPTPAYADGGDDAVPGEIPDFEKIIVECICPKCGARHAMNFPWTGRGVPRKYCPQCKKSL